MMSIRITLMDIQLSACWEIEAPVSFTPVTNDLRTRMNLVLTKETEHSRKSRCLWTGVGCVT